MKIHFLFYFHHQKCWKKSMYVIRNEASWQLQGVNTWSRPFKLDDLEMNLQISDERKVGYIRATISYKWACFFAVSTTDDYQKQGIVPEGCLIWFYSVAVL